MKRSMSGSLEKMLKMNPKEGQIPQSQQIFLNQKLIEIISPLFCIFILRYVCKITNYQMN